MPKDWVEGVIGQRWKPAKQAKMLERTVGKWNSLNSPGARHAPPITLKKNHGAASTKISQLASHTTLELPCQYPVDASEFSDAMRYLAATGNISKIEAAVTK